MLKSFLAVVAAVLPLVAAAQTSVTLSTASATANSSQAHTSRQSIVVKQKLNTVVAVDAGITAGRTNSTKSQTVREELGVTVTQPVAESVTGLVRIAVGYKATARADDYVYYSVEPGVSTALGAGWSAGVGYRYRSSWSTDLDTSLSTRTKISYAIDPHNSVSVGHDRVHGSGAERVWLFGYTRSF